jgi:multiple sugar transport system permease protein
LIAPPSSQSRGNTGASPAVYALLILGSVLMLTPFAWMISSSLKPEAEIRLVPPRLMPSHIEWHNYPDSLGRDKMNLAQTLPNTVVVTVCCVLGQIISSSLVGFGFARFRFRGRGPLFLIMLSTMMLPAQVTMIPMFIIFRWLGWINTFLPLIVPQWLAGPFFVFMFRQFFAQIPEELVEAARMDGASNWRIYWQIMLPLSGPVIAITAIYTFMGTWNDFMNPLIYLNSPSNNTLALALASFNGQHGVANANQLMAASFVTMIPCLLLFAAAQRYFVENISMTGGKS